MAELILALDVENPAEAERIIGLVGPNLELVKIGPRLFAQGGAEFLTRVRGLGKRIFLDLKLHDIPNTVALAVDVLARLELWALTLHTAGGSPMLEAAREARDKAGSALNLLGVTVLTSVDDQVWQEVAPGAEEVGRAVLARAGLAARTGLEGLVCSPLEVAAVRSQVGPEMKTVVPGIRPGQSDDDQRRVATPAQAVADGADYLVVGRPILKAPDPEEAVERILEEMKGARR